MNRLKKWGLALAVAASAAVIPVGVSAGQHDVLQAGNPPVSDNLPQSVMAVSYDTDAVETLKLSLNTEKHVKYINGESDGLFHPDDFLTRAEAAQMIYSLTDDGNGAPPVVAGTAGPNSTTEVVLGEVRQTGVTVTDGSVQEQADAMGVAASATVAAPQTARFSDVSDSEWFANAVNTLSVCNIINGSDGLFRPKDEITRAEFVTVLSNFFDDSEIEAAATSAQISFSDVSTSDWAQDNILFAASQGWITGYPDGTFHPERRISRAEASVVINRVLGRSGDFDTITNSTDIRIFSDVTHSHWAYLHIMEGSIGHEYKPDAAGETSSSEIWISFDREKTVLEPGYHLLDGTLYFVEDSGLFARNKTVDNHSYDTDGKYTTGDAELDSLVRKATADAVSSDMTQHEMLKAVFDYVVDNCSYLKNDILEAGSVGWTEKYAKIMLSRHKGNCYCFASAFCQLAKNVGYNPREVAGFLSNRDNPHGWIEINIDGRICIYDAVITNTLHKDGEDYDIFEIPYQDAPYRYIK